MEASQVSESGLELVEYNVAILPDSIEEKTAGGIILPTNDRSKWEVQEGTIDAMSVHAFSYADWPEGERKPQVGDRIVFGKYAGARIDRNGVEWLVIKDKDVVAVIDAAPAAQLAA
jgi:chaperonin GroES